MSIALYVESLWTQVYVNAQIQSYGLVWKYVKRATNRRL